MIIHCPTCEASYKSDNQDETLPSVCPDCGADLYPEELIFQQLITENDKEIVQV